MNMSQNLSIPQKIAAALDQCESWFRYDCKNLWMGTSALVELEGMTFDEAQLEREKINSVIFDWVNDSKERQSLVIAYLNPATSPKAAPLLWASEEEE